MTFENRGNVALQSWYSTLSLEVATMNGGTLFVVSQMRWVCDICDRHGDSFNTGSKPCHKHYLGF